MSKNLKYLIEHPYFDRLQHIRQMGLSYFVFPTATHSRHEHCLGALQLMKKSIKILKSKGIIISDEEKIAMKIAILLHDIGHGPFSHALETSIVNVHHEDISIILMEALNHQFNGDLSLAIEIFAGSYHRKFMHQLVSSQLDMDRLDYLKRDSFYTKIDERNVNSDALIASIYVVDNELVFEENTVSEIKNFLLARKLMYEKVYLHKTGLVAELMLTKILQRAKELVENNTILEGIENLLFFISNKITKADFNKEALNKFIQLNDIEIVETIKLWQNHSDFVLSTLSKNLIENKFLEIEIQDKPFDNKKIENLKKQFSENSKLSKTEMDYFIFDGNIQNKTYNNDNEIIKILTSNNEIKNLTEIIDSRNLTPINKYYICYSN